jgi:hypothetical protein
MIPLRPALSSPELAFYKSRSEITLPEPDVLQAFRAFVCGAKVGSMEIKEDMSEASSSLTVRFAGLIWIFH